MPRSPRGTLKATQVFLMLKLLQRCVAKALHRARSRVGPLLRWSKRDDQSD